MRLFIFLFSIILLVAGCSTDKNEVVIYCAHDQIYAEPILASFEKQTGVKVKVLYDTELTKTVGLVNRIIAEAGNPRCDVFWNNEISRTILLKNKGLLSAYRSPSASEIPVEFKDKADCWTGFAARGRIIIYNKNRMKDMVLPSSFSDLIKSDWNGKAALANPLFGTTATQAAAMFTIAGKDEATSFFRKVKENKIGILDGNSLVKEQVVKGEFLWGFTDTDDANSAIADGKEVGIIYPDQEGLGTLIIPNTVCLMKNSPNPGNAKRLIDYLLLPETEQLLAQSRAAQIPVRNRVPHPANVKGLDQIKAMDIDFEKVSDELDQSSVILNQLFVK